MCATDRCFKSKLLAPFFRAAKVIVLPWPASQIKDLSWSHLVSPRVSMSVEVELLCLIFHRAVTSDHRLCSRVVPGKTPGMDHRSMPQTPWLWSSLDVDSTPHKFARAGRCCQWSVARGWASLECVWHSRAWPRVTGSTSSQRAPDPAPARCCRSGERGLLPRCLPTI